MIRPQLVVMLKVPQPGRVKTRLGKDLGMTGAAWWFRHQVDALLRRLENPKWDLVLAVAPDTTGMASRVWPEHLERMPQGHGSLGDRMARVFHTRPPGPVCIIGADVPEISHQHIENAFKALGSNDTVFGPAPDGGYWLIGMKRTTPAPVSLFENVRWSTEHALVDTMATLPGKRIAMIDTLQDVDTLADLSALEARIPA